MFNRCYKCFYSKKTCRCKDIIAIETNIKFVILIHPKEALKQKTGTGRLTHLFLNNSELITGIDFSTSNRVNELIKDPAFFSTLLYPSNKALFIENNTLNERKLLIFILDGTWCNVKVMLRESNNLNKLPFISFNSKYISKYKFKKQPKRFCLSTIESAYYILQYLKKNNIANHNAKYENMMTFFSKIVQNQSSYWKGIDKNAKYY